MKLRQALLGCSFGLLRTIATLRGLPVEASTVRSELVDALAAMLTQLAADGDLWGQLATEERALVALVAAARGQHDADLLVRRAGAHRPGAVGATASTTRLARLTERGILFRVFTPGASSSGASYVLPDEYLASIPPWAESNERDFPVAGQGPPVTILESELRRDCFLLASALRREAWNRAARPLVGGTAPSLTRVLARLQAGSVEVDRRRGNERWRVLRRLGEQAGWIRGGSWPRPDDDQVSRFLRNPRLLIAETWATYRSEQTRRLSKRGEMTVRGVQRGDPAQDLLEIVADVPSETWYPEAEFEQWLKGELGWNLGSSGDDAPLNLRRELSGPWFWWGLVRWGFAADGTALLAATPAVRPLVGRALGPDLAGDRQPACLQDNLELVASLHGNLDVLYELEPYLSLIGGTTERRYLLTAASFGRGVRMGGSADELRSLVARLAGQALPARWESEVDAWVVATGRLRADARIVVSASDDEAFAQAMDVAAFADGLGQRLTERMGWIVPERLAAVLHGLDEAGQSITLDAGLRIEGARTERGAALVGGSAELLWVVLGALRRVDSRLVSNLRGADGLLSALELAFTASTRAELDRRAESLADQLRARADRTPGSRRNRPMV